MKISLALLLIVIFLPLNCYSEKAQSVLGFWKYHHSTGSPCKDLIANLNYHFSANGEYTVEAKMRRIGGLSNEKAKGTFKVNANTITTQVENVTIGPLKYRFEKDFLVFEQESPRCDIYLSLEDY